MSWMPSPSTFIGSYLPTRQSIANHTGELVSWLGRSVVLNHQTRLADRLRPYTKLALHNAAGYLIGGLPGCIVGSAIEIFFLDSATYAIVYKLADGAGAISLKTFEAITGATIIACAGAEDSKEEGCQYKEKTLENGYVLISPEELTALLETHESHIQKQKELEPGSLQVQQQEEADGYVLVDTKDLSALLEPHKSCAKQQEPEPTGLQVQQQQQQQENLPKRSKVTADELERSLEKLRKDFFCKKK